MSNQEETDMKRSLKLLLGCASLTIVLAMALSSAALCAGGDESNDPVGIRESTIRFSRVVHLSHQLRTDAPLFPGDPPFTVEIWNTIAHDGFLLENVHHGTHTGTHVSAPGHFIEGGQTIDELPAHMFVHPAVVIDVRERVAVDPDFQITWQDIRAFERRYHQTIPVGACVILFTGFQDRYFNPVGPGSHDDYFDTAPGFHPSAVQRLAMPVGQGGRGVSCLGSDTFGPDATSDVSFGASTAIYEAGGMTIENMANLDKLHPFGDTVVYAPARLRAGSGFQTDVLGFIQE
jgi:kynurenine formamidase